MNTDPAFSAVARDYDATFTDTNVGRLQREVVWKHLSEIHPGPLSVLELNCGTGADAIWMAQRGWQVLSTDISPEMVRITNEKINAAGLTNYATAKVCAFDQIGQMPEGPFDLIFSNFGGLNCIPPEEMAQLGAVLFSKLKPGGQIIAVVMGRFCWWETLYFLLKMKPLQAFRRLKREAVDAPLDAETTVKTWYYSPPACASLLLHGQKTFNNQDKTRVILPVGFWLPPSYLDPFLTKRPILMRLLNTLEKSCSPSWLAPAADHFLVRLMKPPA